MGHGENGLQVGDGGSSHGYDARNSPTTTTNIEVSGNTFAANGLKAILLGSAALASSANVFIHDNKFIGKRRAGNKRDRVRYIKQQPVNNRRSEQIFSLIFDILNVNFQDSGITNQDDSKIVYSVQKNNVGILLAGLT